MKAASLYPPVLASPHPASVAGGAPWPVAVLGVPFDPIPLPRAIDRLRLAIAARSDCLVALGDAPALLRAQRETALIGFFADADVVLAAGPLLAWITARLARASPASVPAASMVRTLAAAARAHGWRVFVLGATAGATAALAADLRRAGVSPERTYAPPVGLPFDPAAAARDVLLARPDLVVVAADGPDCLGWLTAHRRRLGVPAWVRVPEPAGPSPRAGPGRVASALALGRQLWRQRRLLARPSVATGGFVVRTSADWIELETGEILARSVLATPGATPALTAPPGAHWAVDASRVAQVDATALALLARWRATCVRTGRHFILVAPSASLRRTLAAAHVLPLFEIAASLPEARRRVAPPAARATIGFARSLAWCGEITAANVEDVWQMTSDYLANFVAQGATLVTIDLARLRFIDAAGAALMLRTKRSARARRTEILFAHPQPHVGQVLRLTGADLLVLEGGQ